MCVEDQDYKIILEKMPIPTVDAIIVFELATKIFSTAPCPSLIISGYGFLVSLSMG